MTIAVLVLVWIGVSLLLAVLAHVLVIRQDLLLSVAISAAAALAGGLLTYTVLGFHPLWASAAAGVAALGALWGRTMRFMGRQEHERLEDRSPPEELTELRGHRRVVEASHNVLAVYPDVHVATRAARALEESGLPQECISLQTRPSVNDRPAAESSPDGGGEAVAEGQPWRRDERSFRRLSRRALAGIVLGAAAGAVLGFLVGALLYQPTARTTWILVAVLGAIGLVIGFVGAGISGAFQEVRPDAGVIVGAHSEDADQVDSATDVLRRHRPLRIEHYAGGTGTSGA